MAEPASWDLLDEDCAGIGDWDVTACTGAASVTVDPAGQFKLNTGNLFDIAIAKRDVGDTPNTFTFEIRCYHDAIGVLGDNDNFGVWINQADERLFSGFATDGLFLYDNDVAWTEVGTDLVKTGEWQTWRFLVTFGVVGDGTCDVYLTDSTHDMELVGNDIPCSNEGAFTDGLVRLNHYGNTNANRITHIDYIKMATGLYIPEAEVEDNALFFGANF